MQEVRLTQEEWNQLTKAFRETLGVSQYLASIMICRATAVFSDSDVEAYGTNGEETFNQFTLDRLED